MWSLIDSKHIVPHHGGLPVDSVDNGLDYYLVTLDLMSWTDIYGVCLMLSRCHIPFSA